MLSDRRLGQRQLIRTIWLRGSENIIPIIVVISLLIIAIFITADMSIIFIIFIIIINIIIIIIIIIISFYLREQWLLRSKLPILGEACFELFPHIPL